MVGEKRGKGLKHIKSYEGPPTRLPNYGKTTFGDPIVSHVDAINEEYEKYTEMKRKIRAYLEEPVEFQPKAKSWEEKCFMFMTMIPYCKDGPGMLMPAEFSFAAFSFREGPVEGKTSLFDTDHIPYGENLEIRTVCEDNALPFPRKFEEAEVTGTNETVFFQNLERVAKKLGLYLEEDGRKYILIFSTRGEIGILNGCLKWLKERYKNNGKTPPETKIFQFETLVKVMSRMNGNTSDTEGVIEHEGGAAKFIYSPRWDFNPELGCKWHRSEENVGKVCMCANSITLRRIFNTLYYLAHLHENGPSLIHMPPRISANTKGK